jgi:hypothetical protein
MLSGVSAGSPDPGIDPSLFDAALDEEVDLLMRLIAKVNTCDGPLDVATVDSVLFGEGAD